VAPHKTLTNAPYVFIREPRIAGRSLESQMEVPSRGRRVSERVIWITHKEEQILFCR
jgi:hypothetical protein